METDPGRRAGPGAGQRLVDVLIVGAGPAGLAAGIVCARQGLSTLVCEKKQLPVDKACGEGVMPNGLQDLQALGVKDLLQTEDAFPFHGVKYIGPSGRIAAGNFREGCGLGIPRLKLSAALQRRAMQLPGLEIWEGAPAGSFERANGRVLARVDGQQVSARLLVGADGLNSGVRRWAGLQGPAQKLQRWGTRQHYSVTPWSNYVEVYLQKDVEAYVTPCGQHLVGVAYLWNRGLQGLLGGPDLMKGLGGLFPDLAGRLEGAPSADLPLSVGPMHQVAASPVTDGVVLLGDASGYLDAITGEGISLATAQALAFERMVVPLLARQGQAGSLTRKDLEPFARQWRRMRHAYLVMTSLALFIADRPNLADSLLVLFQRWPVLFERMLSANMGKF